jgi:hypothetical protein
MLLAFLFLSLLALANAALLAGAFDCGYSDVALQDRGLVRRIALADSTVLQN